MGKLVRDLIPQIIEASGRHADVRVLSDEEYDEALLDKLVEEVEELRNASPRERLEEAADVYEVLLALAVRVSGDARALSQMADRKRAERGGFEARLWLED